MGNLSYTVTSGTEVSVTGYTAGITSANIPGKVTYNGTEYTVKSIGEEVFIHNTTLKTVTIGEGVVEIGKLAFYNCSSLTTVSIPSTCTTTDNAYTYNNWQGPFGQCENLTTATLAEGIKTIPDAIFQHCTGLNSIVIPKSVTEIKTEAFENCVNLKTVTLQEGLKKIANSAFIKCTSLNNITIPASLDETEDCYYGGEWQGPFGSCSSLTNVTIVSGTTKIPDNIFSYCIGLKTVKIPNTVSSIGRSAFQNCKNLTTVEFGTGVRVINDCAFSNCTKLTNVTLPPNLTELNGKVFENNISISSIKIPKSLVNSDNSYSGGVWGGPFTNCINLSKVEIELGTTSIPGHLFQRCSGITEINFPITVSKINNSAFESCSNLVTVNMSNSITEIEADAFANCTKLTNVALPTRIKVLGGYAFGNCISLKTITIPKTLVKADTEYLGGGWKGPFNNCTGLSIVNFEEGMTYIPDNIMQGSGVTIANIPSTVVTIGESAFKNCVKLTKYNIPKTVNKLCDYAFCNTGFTDVVLSDGINELGLNVFAQCDSLKSITIPSSIDVVTQGFVSRCVNLSTVNLPKYSIDTIECYAFEQCVSLEKITIPASVTTINKGAFLNATALKTIELPSQLRDMGERVFSGCSALTTVKLSAGVTEIPNETFSECTSLKEISIPYRVTNIGDNAFYNCYNLTTFNIPKSVTEISDSAITYPALVTINGVNGSYAQTFANTYDIKFVNKTVKTTGIKFHNSRLLQSTVINGNVGDIYSIIGELLPVNSTEGITWSSSNTKVATVDGDGNVETKSGGKAVITAKSGTVSASFTINVLLPLETVSLNKSSIAFNSIGGYTTLTASKNPTNTSESIVWSSSNTKVATVDQFGKVVAKGYGTAVITAAGNVSSSVNATCNIKVNKVLIGTPVISSVKSLNYNQLQISFGKAANANGYIIYKYNSKTKEFEKIGTTSSTTYIDKAASVGSTSKYKVKAYHLSYGAYTYGAQSAEKSGKAVPKQVTRLKQNSYSASSVTMKWTSLSGVSGYTIVRSSSAKGTYKSIKTLTTNVSSFKDTTCSAATNYYYKIKAYKLSSGGTKIYGAYSDPIKMTTKPNPTKLTLANAGTGKIKISWLKASGSNGYELYMSTSKNGKYTKIKSANNLTLTYTKTGLNRGKTYYFKLKSYKTSASGAKYYSGFSDVKKIVVK